MSIPITIFNILQPRININSNDISWLNTSTKLLGYNNNLIHWLKQALNHYQKHKLKNDAQYKEAFIIVQDILQNEIPMYLNNGINWKQLHIQECKQIARSKSNFNFWNPFIFINNLLMTILEYTIKYNCIFSCPYQGIEYKYLQCSNHECYYFNNPKIHKHNISCIHMNVTCENFDLQNIILHMDQIQIFKDKQCCLKMDNKPNTFVCNDTQVQMYQKFDTNQVLFIAFGFSNHIIVHIPQFIHVPQNNNNTNFYIVKGIILQNVINKSEYATIIQNNNKSYFLYNDYKKMRLNPCISDFFNTGNIQINNTQTSIRNSFIPIILMYEIHSTLSDNHSENICNRLHNIKNEYQNFLNNCNNQYLKLKKQIELPKYRDGLFVTKELIQSISYDQIKEANHSNLLTIKLKCFKHKDTNVFEVNHNDNQILRERQEFLSDPNLKLLRNKHNKSISSLDVAYENFLIACQKLNICNFDFSANINYHILYNKLFNYQTVIFNSINLNGLIIESVSVTFVLLIRSKTYSFLIKNHVFIKHRTCKQPWEIQLKCVDHKYCHCPQMPTINFKNKTIRFNIHPITHVDPKFENICRRFVKDQLYEEYIRMAGDLQAYDYVKQLLYKIKNIMISEKTCAPNMPFPTLPSLHSMRDMIKKIQQSFNKNFANITELGEFLAQQPNYLYEIEDNNIAFCSINALFRILHSDTNLADGTFPKIKYSYNKLGCKQVYIIAS